MTTTQHKNYNRLVTAIHVSKGDIIGLRKAYYGQDRDPARYSCYVGLIETMLSMRAKEGRLLGVDDDLYTTGCRFLQRMAKTKKKLFNLRTRAIAETPDSFSFLGFYQVDRAPARPAYFPIWRAHGPGGYFDYINPPWQAQCGGFEIL